MNMDIFKFNIFRKTKNKWEVVSELLMKIEQLDRAMILPQMYYEGLEKFYGSKVAGDINTMLEKPREKYVELLKLVLSSKE
jgi:hypothetical protein